jgi:hypothetical protein
VGFGQWPKFGLMVNGAGDSSLSPLASCGRANACFALDGTWVAAVQNNWRKRR